MPLRSLFPLLLPLDSDKRFLTLATVTCEPCYLLCHQRLLPSMSSSKLSQSVSAASNKHPNSTWLTLGRWETVGNKPGLLFPDLSHVTGISFSLSPLCPSPRVDLLRQAVFIGWPFLGSSTLITFQLNNLSKSKFSRKANKFLGVDADSACLSPVSSLDQSLVRDCGWRKPIGQLGNTCLSTCSGSASPKPED